MTECTFSNNPYWPPGLPVRAFAGALGATLLGALVMHRGWVKLWRKTVDSVVFADEGLLKLWVFCLLAANHKDELAMVRGLACPIKVKRGQFITGRHVLHAGLYPRNRKTDVSEKTTWRRLKTLEKLGNLSLVVTNRFTMVTVCQFETYNDGPSENVPPSVRPVSDRCPAGGPPVGTNKKRENVKKGEKESLSAFADDPKLKPEVFQRLWNAAACKPGLKPVRKWTDARLAKIRTRLAEAGWWEACQEAVAKLPLPTSPGKTWQPPVDWILANPDNVFKILEGNYDWRKDSDRPIQNDSPARVREPDRYLEDRTIRPEAPPDA